MKKINLMLLLSSAALLAACGGNGSVSSSSASSNESRSSEEAPVVTSEPVVTTSEEVPVVTSEPVVTTSEAAPAGTSEAAPAVSEEKPIVTSQGGGATSAITPASEERPIETSEEEKHDKSEGGEVVSVITSQAPTSSFELPENLKEVKEFLHKVAPVINHTYDSLDKVGVDLDISRANYNLKNTYTEVAYDAAGEFVSQRKVDEEYVSLTNGALSLDLIASGLMSATTPAELTACAHLYGGSGSLSLPYYDAPIAIPSGDAFAYLVDQKVYADIDASYMDIIMQAMGGGASSELSEGIKAFVNLESVLGFLNLPLLKEGFTPIDEPTLGLIDGALDKAAQMLAENNLDLSNFFTVNFEETEEEIEATISVSSKQFNLIKMVAAFAAGEQLPAFVKYLDDLSFSVTVSFDLVDNLVRDLDLNVNRFKIADLDKVTDVRFSEEGEVDYVVMQDLELCFDLSINLEYGFDAKESVPSDEVLATYMEIPFSYFVRGNKPATPAPVPADPEF